MGTIHDLTSSHQSNRQPVSRSRSFLRFGASAAVLATVSALLVVDAAGAQTTPSSSSSSSSTSTSTSTSTTSTSTTTSTTIAATTSTSTTSTTIAASAPSVPRNVAAALTGTAQITVTWAAPESLGTPALTSYKVVALSIVGNTSSTSAPVSVAPNVTSYVFNDLRPGVAYAFYVRAENAAGQGPNTVFTAPIIVPGPATTQPAAPSPVTNPNAALINGQLRVTWTPPTSSPTAIVRYRITTIPSIGSIVVSASSLAVTFGSPRPGVTYIAQIFAVGVNGKESAPINTNPVAVPALPAPPVTAAPPVQPLPLPGQAPTPPGRPKPCVRVSWPKYVYGRPQSLRAGAPQGVYMWHDGRYWQVRVYNPGPGGVLFQGSVVANTKVTFTGYGLERNDRLSRRRSSAAFAFNSDYDIDSLRISASCATALRFNFTVNGQPVPADRIFIGPAGIASASDFSIVR
jgi:hypothetical protein